MAVVNFLEEAGPRMRKLWLTYSSQTTAILGALLVGWWQAGAGPSAEPGTAGPLSLRSVTPLQGGCCPRLQVLEVSAGISRNGPPLPLPVEALQKGCPQLQVLMPASPACWYPAPCLPRLSPSLPICSLGLAPGAAAPEPDVAAQAFRASGGSGPGLPQPRGALPRRLHLQLCERRGPAPPAPRLPESAPAGSSRLCPHHSGWPV